MKIIVLMEDNLRDNNIVAEHGLSLYIETKKHKLILDTGKSEKTWDNALAKGVDITQVDTVILSHGHYDHSGGMMKLAEYNDHADIYVRDNADGEYYSCKNGIETYIGIDKKIMDLPNLHKVYGNIAIDDEISLFTGITPGRMWPKGNRRLHMLSDGAYVQDSFAHEQYLVIRYDDKYALISGCAHNGILNIIDGFRHLYNTDPAVVISGFHMIQTLYSEEDIEEIGEVAKELNQMDTVFYTGHCTGDTAYGIMKGIMGDKLKAICDM